MSGDRVIDLPRLGRGDSDADVAAALDEAGCCVIDSAVPASTVDDVAADMAPFVEATARGDTDFAGPSTRRTGMVLARSAAFRRELALHPTVVGAAHHVLGHAPTWNLSFAHFFELFPGEPDQLLHRDEWKYGAPPFPADVDLNALWAVTEFTTINGATRVVPGSHTWEPDRRPSPDDAVSVTAPKGSLFLYTGRVFHGGGASSGDDVRLAVNVQHSVGWLSQTERMLLEYPPAVVADWDDELIRRIGYQLSGPALGHWRNAEDPFTAVEEYRQTRAP